MLCVNSNVCVCAHADVFKLDPDFLENEEKYKTIKKGENVQRQSLTVQSSVTSFTTSLTHCHLLLLTDILDEGSSDSGEDGDGSDEDEEEEEQEEEGGEGETVEAAAEFKRLLSSCIMGNEGSSVFGACILSQL